MKMSKKTLALLAAMVLAIGVAAGSTLAWLTDTTGDVVNTFTTSDVDIELFETDDEGKHIQANSYQMIPGYTYKKDPTITVADDSEDCYVFVKVAEKIGISANVSDYLDYAIDEGEGAWTALPGVSDVYYRTAKAKDSFTVLKGNEDIEAGVVSVKESVTKEMMDAFGGDTEKYPTLTFTAYACQYMKNNTENFTPQEAWDVLNPPAP